MIKWNLDLLVNPYKNISYTFKAGPNSGQIYLNNHPDHSDSIEKKIINMAEYREARELIDSIRKK